MNKGKNLELLIQKIPQELTQIEKARWVYIELGRMFQYDINFFYTDKETARKMYYQEADIENIEQLNLICRPINQIYIEILKRIGIEAELITFPGKYTYNHVACRIKTSAQKQYVTDLTMDLYRIKKGLRTQHFANSIYEGKDEILFKDEMQEMDDKINYTYHGLYMEDVLQMIKEEMANPELVKEYILKDYQEKEDWTESEIVEAKFHFLVQHTPFKELGHSEAKSFIIHVIQTVLEENEKRYIRQYDLHKEDKRGSSNMNCIKIDLQTGAAYYLLKENCEFQKVTEEEIRNFISKGWISDRLIKELSPTERE